MSCPALIQLPDGNWIDPTIVTGIVAADAQDKNASGRVVIFCGPGTAVIQTTGNRGEACRLRDEIAEMILDATNEYRHVID